MPIMTAEEAVKYFNNRKEESEKAIARIKKADEEVKNLGINFKESSRILIDYYVSEIRLCEHNLSKLQENKTLTK